MANITYQTQSARTRRSKSVRGTRKNGHPRQASVKSFNPPSSQEVREKIEKKIGKMPKIPQGFAKGDWTDQAIRVLSERYLIKNESAEVVETPEEMCWRVAWEMASAEAMWGKDKKGVERIAREFYNLLVSREFLPNSPTLMNAGTGNFLQYSACFVLPVEDSLEGIFDAIKWQAVIHKTGGGTGFAFSRLRPRGSFVKKSQGVASGPVSFMRIFDAATNEVKQGGRRRGANMGILRVDHPDILEFIHCKEEGGITNFNISVAVTDKFMEAYEKDTEYDLVDPRNGEVTGKLLARKVFDEISEGAWRTGDPGLVFIDRMNKGTANPVPTLGPVESTNPCGEQPLYPFDSCNLGSIFLTYFVKEDDGRKDVDWEKLKRVTRQAVRFMDGVIEMNPYPIEQIRNVSLGIRRIGLGIGGWADMLIQLGIPYDSEEALLLAEKIMRTISEEAVAETKELARERGPFPLWPTSIYKDEEPRRNSTVTTIAPTGSIAIIAGSSSGIEPLFAIAFQHIVRDKHLDRTLTFFNPKFESIAKEQGFWSEEIKQKVIEEGVIRDIEEIPPGVRALFGTAHEIDPDWHVRTQAVFQKYTENAVSKTINLRNEATVEDIKKAYLLAWETDCKGITVFRDGCKSAQVLNLGVKPKEERKPQTEPGHNLIQRPFKASGATYRIKTPTGTAFITINEDEGGQPLEVFINIGRAGSDVSALGHALGRTISTALRLVSGISPFERAKEIASNLSGIGGRSSIGFGPNKVRSLPDAVAVAFSTHYGFKINGGSLSFPQGLNSSPNLQAGSVTAAHQTHPDPLPDPADVENLADGDGFQANLWSDLRAQADICPECGSSSFVYEEGCSKCYVCGFSEC